MRESIDCFDHYVVRPTEMLTRISSYALHFLLSFSSSSFDQYLAFLRRHGGGSDGGGAKFNLLKTSRLLSKSKSLDHNDDFFRSFLPVQSSTVIVF